MQATTLLDKAHAAMMARPEEGELRLSFYALLADSEVFLLLERESEGETIEPRLLELEGARYVLGFDSADRLTQFAGGAAPYAAVPGRIMAEMLAQEGAGLAFNLEIAPSSIMLPHEAMAWMVEALALEPQAEKPKASGIGALKSPDVPEVLLHALDAKLARAAGLASTAYLCERENGGLMLAILGASEPAQAALAKAASEALVFSGLEDVSLDVAFFNESESLRAQLRGMALRFDIPEPRARERITPGSDPSAPPKLR